MGSITTVVTVPKACTLGLDFRYLLLITVLNHNGVVLADAPVV